MGIDDAGQRDHAGGIDRLGAAAVERRADGQDRAILDQDVGRREIAQRLVHGDDLGITDMQSVRHGRES